MTTTADSRSTEQQEEKVTSTLRVCALYPDLLNIYADRGNIMVLRERCRWRGIGFNLTNVSLNDELDSDAYDLFYIGGGQDRDQELCAADLIKLKRDGLFRASQRGAVIFAVCGGYQLLGNYYEVNGRRLPGSELVDLHTVNSNSKRLVGNVAINTNFNSRVLAGFENHGGRTILGNEQPLGKIIQGHGNNDEDGTEGVCGGPHGTIIGTYLHGPLLPKNSWFADWLIARSLKIKESDLPRLDSELELTVHSDAYDAAMAQRTKGRRFIKTLLPKNAKR